MIRRLLVFSAGWVCGILSVVVPALVLAVWTEPPQSLAWQYGPMSADVAEFHAQHMDP